MRRWHAAVPPLLLAAAVGCGRSCGCLEGEKAYESLDGKVKVELVRKVNWVGGKIPGPVTGFVVRVHTTPILDHRVPCDHVDLAEDDEGTNVGYRCKGDSAWNVLRLRGGDTYLFDCDAPVGAEKKPRFAQLEPVRIAADRIAECILKYSSFVRDPSRDLSVLTRAIEKDAGPTEAGSFVARFASARAATDSWAADRWDVAFDGLSAPAREEVRRELCPALGDASAPAPRYVRAARLCPLDGGDVARGAAERFRAALAAPAPEMDSSYEAESFRWAALLTDAGDVACDALGNLPEKDPRLAPTIRTIARTRARCRADLRAKLGAPCGRVLLCDGGLCAASDNASAIARETSRMHDFDAGLRAPQLTPANAAVAGLGALYAQGPLPNEVVQRNARLTYAVPEEGGTNCGDVVATGTPCWCGPYGVGEWEICGLPLDGGTERHVDCDVRAIDAKRTIEVTTACRENFGECDVGKCCPGYRCEERGDSGSKSCMLDR